MLLDDCYRLLDVDSSASLEEVERAHRDLMKVWHPDRFGHDPSLRRKAEEKLKAINAAHDAIRAARAGEWGGGTAHQSGSLNPVSRWPFWAMTIAALAVVVLLRRPTSVGLLIALVLLTAAGALLLRVQAARRR